MAKKLQLIPGKFYRSIAGDAWCCFKVIGSASQQAQARCVRVEDDLVEYFYLDGRYDEAGKREHTLVEEI